MKLVDLYTKEEIRHPQMDESDDVTKLPEKKNHVVQHYDKRNAGELSTFSAVPKDA